MTSNQVGDPGDQGAPGPPPPAHVAPPAGLPADAAMPAGAPASPPNAEAGAQPRPGAAGGVPPADAEPRGAAARPAIRRGLLLWLLVAGGGGVASVAAGRLEGAGLLAIAGLFALAQATDAAAAVRAPLAPWPAPARGFPPAAAIVRALVRVIVPAGGTLFYASIAAFARAGGADAEHRLAAAWSVGAALTCLALALPAVERAAARALFRGDAGPPGRTRCLAAQLAVVLLLLPVPGRLLFPDLIAVARASGTALADPGALSVQLGGEVAFAVAGVGLWVRRDARAAAARLGLGPMRAGEWGLAVAGVLAAIVLNSGMEAAEHAWLPRLWRADAETTRLIAARLPVAVSLLLGTSAGVGEELVVRGALQPRAGVLAAALLFACGHVQYTWFGMLTIALLGVLLGVIRRRAGTTTAIVVHALYDVFAALTSS